MGLKDLNLHFKYDSDEDNILDEFYIPVLEQSKEYYRASGFFSSSALAISAKGIEGLIRNGGKMKLICSAKLQPHDLEIIEESKSNPFKFIENSFLNDLDNLEEGFVRNHVEALGWMLANDYLDIKIAIPLEDDSALYHLKIGVMKDNEGNAVAFSGSENETASAWANNIEEFKVFRNWGDESENRYFHADLDSFNKYWNDNAKKTEVIELPVAIKKKLIEIAPSDKEELKIIKKKKSSIKLREYQNEAINNWFDNDCKGIFEMATGTGKTFTGLAAFKKLLNQEKKLLTIISCPQIHLIDQWIKSIKKFYNGKILVVSSQNSNWKSELNRYKKGFYLGKLDKLVIVTTHRSMSSNYFIDTVEGFNVKKLLIVDEVHGIGSSKQMYGLIDDYDFRLGLSATPERKYDDVGTNMIFDYFKGIVFQFDIEKALKTINPDTGKHYLTPYEYHPIIVQLNNEEYNEYMFYSAKIGAILGSNKNEKAKTLDYYINERQKIINNAEAKYTALKKILKDNKGMDKLLVFCSPQQIRKVQEILDDNGIIQHKFTQVVSAKKSKNQQFSEREDLIIKFENGDYDALVAIKCLDEGVDIPIAENAIMMFSTSNPRVNIQRRGRLLRNYPGKEKAVIYDMLVFPKDTNKSMAHIREKEIDRYLEFARHAENSVDCLKILENVLC